MKDLSTLEFGVSADFACCVECLLELIMSDRRCEP